MEQSSRILEVLQTPDEDETCRTFILKDEDHTFGNALRYVISMYPEVEHCGYSVPHPSVHNINFRVQTIGVPATEIFKRGLKDLQKLCDHMKETFEGAVENYKEKKSELVEPKIEKMDT